MKSLRQIVEFTVKDGKPYMPPDSPKGPSREHFIHHAEGMIRSYKKIRDIWPRDAAHPKNVNDLYKAQDELDVWHDPFNEHYIDKIGPAQEKVDTMHDIFGDDPAGGKTPEELSKAYDRNKHRWNG